MFPTGSRPIRTVTEASQPALPSMRPEDRHWRSLSKHNRTDRDLPAYTQDRMVGMSFTAYRTNPLAHRLIEMQVSFVLGNGITITSDDPALLAVIQQWWSNEWNNWPHKIHRRLRDLYIYGEWLHRPVVNTDTGFVFINDIQPDTINAIELDPGNHSEIDKIVFKQTLDEQYSHLQRNVSAYTIRRRLDYAKATLGPWAGDVFFFGINRTSDANRGVGELFPVLDYLDIYDAILYARAEKIETMSHVFWDLEIEGMSEKQMQDYVANETNLPPAPGTIWAHNPQARLSAVTPDLKSDDHAVDTSNIKSFIVSSMGWPGTWFDDPGTAGRAVGAEMAEPALKNIVSLQTIVGQLLRTEIDYVVANARQAGILDKTKDASAYTVSFNRPSARDVQRIGPALARVAQFLETGVKIDTMTRSEARQVIVSQINQLGLTDSPMSIELPTELEKAGNGYTGQTPGRGPSRAAPDRTRLENHNDELARLSHAVDSDREFAGEVLKAMSENPTKISKTADLLSVPL